MPYFREEQNHRWAHNLAAAKKYFLEGKLKEFYSGDLDAEFKYPGMKILGAFWVAENMEMRERLSIHLDVLNLANEQEYVDKSNEFFELFIKDFEAFGNKYELYCDKCLTELFTYAREKSPLDDDWATEIADLQSRSDQMVESNVADDKLLHEWLLFCGRFILGYARNLIRQGVRTALYVKYNGKEALIKAIEPTIEYFSWQINRLFYNVAMPQTGFSDLADIVSLGSYGMLADQAVDPSKDKVEEGKTYKYSYLTTCQLYGFIDSCADMLGVEKHSTTHAYCKYCVGHGRTTMHFVVPPDRTVKYYLDECLGEGDKRCTFTLETEPGEDDERCDQATMTIFGDEPLSYK